VTETNWRDFEAWLAAVDVLANAAGGTGSYTQQTGIECWRDSYEDDLTPEDAWWEEVWAGAT
jgi:hypothetical protein